MSGPGENACPFWYHTDKILVLGQSRGAASALAARETDPLKQWKLSPIDRASLDKWDEYTEAKEAMFFYTDTADAPWTIVKSDDKKRARLNALQHFLPPNTLHRQRQNHGDWPRPIDCRRQRPCNRNRPPHYQQGGPPRLKARAGGQPGLIEGGTTQAFDRPGGLRRAFSLPTLFPAALHAGDVPRVFGQPGSRTTLAAQRERV